MTSSPGPLPGPRHPERDQDLLLLAHHALPPVPAALTHLHLIRCAGCRRRLGEMRTASHALAAAVRSPGMPRWSRPAPSGAALTVWALLAATVLLGGILLVLTMRGHHQPHAAVPRAGGPCRPDLPNDRCR